MLLCLQAARAVEFGLHMVRCDSLADVASHPDGLMLPFDLVYTIQTGARSHANKRTLQRDSVIRSIVSNSDYHTTTNNSHLTEVETKLRHCSIDDKTDVWIPPTSSVEDDESLWKDLFLRVWMLEDLLWNLKRIDTQALLRLNNMDICDRPSNRWCNEIDHCIIQDNHEKVHTKLSSHNSNIKQVVDRLSTREWVLMIKRSLFCTEVHPCKHPIQHGFLSRHTGLISFLSIDYTPALTMWKHRFTVQQLHDGFTEVIDMYNETRLCVGASVGYDAATGLEETGTQGQLNTRHSGIESMSVEKRMSALCGCMRRAGTQGVTVAVNGSLTDLETVCKWLVPLHPSTIIKDAFSISDYNTHLPVTVSQIYDSTVNNYTSELYHTESATTACLRSLESLRAQYQLAGCLSTHWIFDQSLSIDNIVELLAKSSRFRDLNIGSSLMQTTTTSSVRHLQPNMLISKRSSVVVISLSDCEKHSVDVHALLEHLLAYHDDNWICTAVWDNGIKSSNNGKYYQNKSAVVEYEPCIYFYARRLFQFNGTSKFPTEYQLLPFYQSMYNILHTNNNDISEWLQNLASLNTTMFCFHSEKQQESTLVEYSKSYIQSYETWILSSNAQRQAKLQQVGNYSNSTAFSDGETEETTFVKCLRTSGHSSDERYLEKVMEFSKETKRSNNISQQMFPDSWSSDEINIYVDTFRSKLKHNDLKVMTFMIAYIGDVTLSSPRTSFSIVASRFYRHNEWEKNLTLSNMCSLKCVPAMTLCLHKMKRVDGSIMNICSSYTSHTVNNTESTQQNNNHTYNWETPFYEENRNISILREWDKQLYNWRHLLLAILVHIDMKNLNSSNNGTDPYVDFANPSKTMHKVQSTQTLFQLMQSMSSFTCTFKMWWSSLHADSKCNISSSLLCLFPLTIINCARVSLQASATTIHHMIEWTKRINDIDFNFPYKYNLDHSCKLRDELRYNSYKLPASRWDCTTTNNDIQTHSSTEWTSTHSVCSSFKMDKHANSLVDHLIFSTGICIKQATVNADAINTYMSYLTTL